MAYEIKMPQFGLTMEEGTVSKWLKNEGDAVKVGDVIMEITTDKLTNEFVSEYEGVLLKIVAQEGEDIPVKGLLCYIGQPGEAVGGAAPAAAPAAEAAPAPAAAAPVAPAADVPTAAPAAAPAGAVAGSVNAPMPGTILKVNVQNGQAVKEGDVLVVLEAMKMENEILAPKAGTVSQVLVSKGSTVDTGAALVVLA